MMYLVALEFVLHLGHQLSEPFLSFFNDCLYIFGHHME